MSYTEDNAVPRVDNPGKLLLETGLLFEINRRVLHPFGLALEVVTDLETGDIKLGGLWDYRDDPEGILYQEDAFRHGNSKLKKFLDETGYDKLRVRSDLIGFMCQGGLSTPPTLSTGEDPNSPLQESTLPSTQTLTVGGVEGVPDFIMAADVFQFILENTALGTQLNALLNDILERTHSEYVAGIDTPAWHVKCGTNDGKPGIYFEPVSKQNGEDADVEEG